MFHNCTLKGSEHSENVGRSWAKRKRQVYKGDKPDARAGGGVA